MANPLLDALSTVGYALDTPGAYLRGALSGKLGERSTGRDLLSTYGLSSSDDPWGGVKGFGVEAILDPLSLVGPVLGAWKGASRIGGIFGHADDVSPLGRAIGASLGLDPRFRDLRDRFTMVKDAGWGGVPDIAEHFGTGAVLPRFVGGRDLRRGIEAGDHAVELDRAMAKAGRLPEDYPMAPVERPSWFDPEEDIPIEYGRSSAGGFYAPELNAGAVLSSKYRDPGLDIGRLSRHEVGHGLVDQAVKEGPEAIAGLPFLWRPGAYLKHAGGGDPSSPLTMIGRYLDEIAQYSTEHHGVLDQLRGGAGFALDPELAAHYGNLLAPTSPWIRGLIRGPSAVAEFLRSNAGRAW